MLADTLHASLPQPGDLFLGKYRIERLIGKGGMGAVFSAEHTVLRRRFAIKFLLGDALASTEAIQRFLTEARHAAMIQSEHVARVSDADVAIGLPYMIIEFLDGSDLSQVIERRGALPVQETVDYVLQGLEGIHQAHALGIIHRDLKPSNLFLAERTDGTSLVKVLDFGISKSVARLTEAGVDPLTATNAMLGSPLYMSPEQLSRPKGVDFRADIWSVGVILYELLSAQRPFKGETVGELFSAILQIAPAPLGPLNPSVPARLEAVIMRCLCKDREQRWANVGELARALAPFASVRWQGLPVVVDSRPTGPTGHVPNPSNSAASGAESWESPKRSRVVLFTALALLAGIAGIGVIAGVRAVGRKVPDASAASAPVDTRQAAPPPPVSVTGARVAPPTASAVASTSASSPPLRPAPVGPSIKKPTATSGTRSAPSSTGITIE